MSRVTICGTFGTEPCAIIKDRLYRRDRSKRGVIFCHGLNGQHWNPVNYPDSVIDEMAKRGYCVLSPDLGGKATWGNDSAQTKLADAKAYLEANEGVKTGGVLLWCGSMGTLAGLNYLRAHPGDIAGLADGLPAVDLADLHDNAVARGITAQTIEDAYGGLTGYNAARAAHNPMEHAAEYVTWKDRIHLWYSNDDPTTIPARVQAFSATSGVSITSMGNAGGHVFLPVFAPAVADFLETFN